MDYEIEGAKGHGVSLYRLLDPPLQIGFQIPADFVKSVIAGLVD